MTLLLVKFVVGTVEVVVGSIVFESCGGAEREGERSKLGLQCERMGGLW